MKVTPQLRLLLTQNNLSQKELVKKTGIPASILSRFDAQKSHKDEYVFLICQALHCKAEDLFRIEDE